MKQLLTLLCLSVMWVGSMYGQYCTPTYFTGTTLGDSISSFSVGTITGTYPGATSGYNDYTGNDTTTLHRGQTYTATIVNNPTETMGVSAWIDYNNDQVFTDDELLGSETLLGGETKSITFTVPATAILTTTRLRMMSRSFSIPTGPCSSTSYGETEDYSVTLAAATGDDAGVTAVLPLASDCSVFGSGVTLDAVVGNFGANSLSNLDVYYAVNGGTPVMTTLASLLGGIQDTVSFATPIVLPNPNTVYTIDVWTEVTGDVNASNDTTSITVTTPAAITFPMFEDFESFTTGTPGTLANGWTSNGTPFAWYVDASGTPSSSTGPDGNHTQGGSNYMFTETSSGSTGDAKYLTSPCVDMSAATGSSQLNFWYHMYGATMGTLEVHILSGGQDSLVWTLTGQQQTASSDPWMEASIDVSYWNGQTIQIQFVGTRGTSYTGDMAIDDVMLFQAVPVDMGATAIVSPLDPSCYGPNESVTVEVKNLGSSMMDFSQNNVTVHLDVSGASTQSVSTVLTSGTLDVDSTMNVVVSNNVDLSAAGTHTFTAYTSIVADPNAFNDSTSGTVDALPLYSNGFNEDFETFTSGNPQTLYPNGWQAFSTSTSAFEGWRARTGATTSSNTGPSGNNTPNGALYMHVEASGVVPADTFDLMSPCLDVSSLSCPKVSFYYHMYGNDIGTLELIAVTPTGEISLWSVTGQQQSSSADAYLKAVADLSGITGSFNLVFRVYGCSTFGDIAIDDVNIITPIPVDVAAGDITSPEQTCSLGASENITVDVINFGAQALTGITASFSVDGGAFSTAETVPGTLNACDTTSFTFSATADLSAPGYHTIQVVTEVTGDTVPTNDTTEITLYTFSTSVSSYPYLETFENGKGGWTDMGTNTSWAFGTPAKSTIIGAASGDSAWVTGGLGTGNYNNSEDSYVLGPCFDFTSLTVPYVRMKIWWHSEWSWDGAVLQTSIDGGLTWQNVGSYGDPDNWYNDNTVNGSPGGSQEAWTGNNNNGSNGWVVAEHELVGLGGQPSVQLRVAFGSDGSVNGYDGFAFDDVEIFELPAYNAAALEVLSPASGCGLSDSSIVSFVMTNKGAQDLIGLNLGYQVNGGTAVIEAYGDTLAVGDTVTYVFNTPLDLSAQGTYNISMFTSHPSDPDAGNDTLHTIVIHKPAITSFPWTENFDNFTIPMNGTIFNDGDPVIALSNGWENLQGDGHDWTVTEFNTPSSGTGPLADHTTGNGRYIYLEDGGFSDTAVTVVSPCFDLSYTNQAMLTFWYHSLNPSTFSADNILHVDIEENGVVYQDVIPALGSTGVNDWTFVQVDLSAYTGVISIRFRGEGSTSWGHDIAIDDVNILNLIPQDAGIALNFLPETGCGLTNQEDIVVALANLGLDTLNGGMTVNYHIEMGGNTVSSGSVASTDTIAPGSFAPFFINNQPFANAGTYTVSVWTSGVAGDINVANDTLTYEVVSVPTISNYPYVQDFENGAEGWLSDGSPSSWEIGTPGGQFIQGAASGVNAWVTGDSSDYYTSEQSAVISPCFDFTALTNPVIDLMINYETFFGDGAVLQSSIDGGTTWQNVGSVGDAVNWFNTANMSGNPGGQGDGWYDNSGGWIKASHDLTGLGGQASVKLRVAFGSNTFSQTEGFAFDDVVIYDRPTDNVGVISVDYPGIQTCTTDSLEIMLSVANYGLDTQYTVPVVVDVTGPVNSTVNFSYTDTLAVNDTVTFSAGTFNASMPGTYTLTAYTTLAGDTLTLGDTTVFSVLVNQTPDAPITFGDSTCATDSAEFMLVAQQPAAGTILWYDSAMNVLQLGDTLYTGVLTEDRAYYAAAANPALQTGFTPADQSIGSGSFTSATFRGLVFDAHQPFRLNTLRMFLPAPGTVGITIRDNAGNIVNDTTYLFYGTVNDTVFTLDWDIPIGDDYLITADGSLFAGFTGPGYNFNGATYPMSVGNALTIKDTDNGLGQSFGYYYFFYDWNVTTLGCISEPTKAVAKFLSDVPVDLGADGTVCSGFELDAYLPSIVSYVWNGDSTLTGSTYAVDQTGMYTVDVVDMNGCTGADTVVFFVTPSPAVDLGADADACEEYELDAGNPGALYVWSDPSAVSQTYTATQSGTYWVAVTANGCTSTDTIEIMINPTPMVDLGNDMETCMDVTLDAGAGTGYTYDWSNGATSQQINVMAPTVGADTISVTVTSVDGCVASDEVVIAAGVAPTVDLGADTTGCDSVALGVAPEAGYTYTWSNGATGTDVMVSTSGMVSLTVVNTDGCEATDSVDVALNFTPVADATYDNNDGDFTIEFSNLSSPIAGTDFEWDFGDGGISTDVHPVYTYAFGGSFPVVLTAVNECGVSTYEFIVGGVDIDEELFGGALQVYPNPTTGEVFVVAEGVEAEQLRIDVLDAQGRAVQQISRDHVYGDFNERLDLTNMAEGVYIIRITDGAKVAVKRVMVSK
ncbi:GEVED domain-containing protein [Pontibacter sp. G13]|uniref:GEVED domain-containing protein n=1 Tax=Pontibacter sp. G13 TaxID=3074898 RepID=UPI00288A73F6|nr:GEVED domain-containing protein [Pontibacter sp. G13]WNJ21628.1 GEVED domain-containing protein [Pontibacter sp. G13]